MATVFFDRNIPDECHQKIKDFIGAGDEVICVAFAPGSGAHWSVIAKSGAFFNRNIPDECHQKMQDMSAGAAKVIRVAFPPQGGNSWSVINDQGAYFNRNIPEECHEKMADLSKNGARIISVAFPPAGGNSWSIVNDQGAYFNRNIPDECHEKMGDLSAGSAKIVCVAFPKQGGNSWSIVNNQGAFFNRNIPDEAHMYMGYFTSVYGPIRRVAFDMDGSGWAIASNVTKNERICDATQCVSIADVYENIQDRLNGRVVGYACSVGAGSIGAFSNGQARTSANAPAQLFLPSTKIPVASVSKTVTALAAIRVLAKNNVNLDAGIGGHLPSDWVLDPHVAKITFRQLLSHRSGIKDYGNVSQEYAALKTFFTQHVDPTKNTPCQGSAVQNPPNPFNTQDFSSCYSNYNFSIFRVLLPWIDGFVDDPAHRAAKLAAAYIKLVQEHVFEPVGAPGVDAKPPATGSQSNAYAFSYKYPGTEAGVDWGDNSLGVGAAGWYLAIDDIDKVLYSLNKNDGRILTSAQLQDMQQSALGWDHLTSNGYRWVEKNGGWGSNGTTISTSIALFGPGVFGALFVNSDFSGPGLQNDWRLCSKCQVLSFAGNSSMGNCPAGGTHEASGHTYLVPTSNSTVTGQHNWRWCTKCQALSFAGGTSPGKCSGGGNHDHAGSGDYVLPSKSGNLPLDTEDNWRWCKKCQVLAFAGNASLGNCAAGGMHDHTGSGDYYLGYVVKADTVLREAYMNALKPK